MDPEMNQINVIPLVDVMLVLLVIVLTTATFITTGHIPVDLAKASEAAAQPDEPIRITLTSKGTLFLNDQEMSREGLIARLQEFPRKTLVVVRADRIIKLEQFVDVVDEVKGEGFQQVSLAVERK
ncbi:MAG: biopolymer transport protein ExbD [Nitrospirales bacterium]|nr:MAG: biopolymer transport protein ExbD [Nitrospirales bacterium]GJL65103.1 MAG: biopolymer transport protein ExbD [Nitrospirales bacterium]